MIGMTTPMIVRSVIFMEMSGITASDTDLTFFTPMRMFAFSRAVYARAEDLFGVLTGPPHILDHVHDFHDEDLAFLIEELISVFRERKLAFDLDEVAFGRRNVELVCHCLLADRLGEILVDLLFLHPDQLAPRQYR